MKDRNIHALTVVLDDDIRMDDAQPIIKAIEMIKHVNGVKPVVSDPNAWFAVAKARRDLATKLWDALGTENE